MGKLLFSAAFAIGAHCLLISDTPGLVGPGLVAYAIAGVLFSLWICDITEETS